MARARRNAIRRCFPKWLVQSGALLPLVCVGLLGAPEAARGQGYGLTTVADLSTPLPGALGPTQRFREAILDGANITFVADYTTGGWGMYLSTPSGFTWVTDSNQLIPGTSVQQDRAYLVGISGDRIAYYVEGDFAQPDGIGVLMVGTPGAQTRISQFDSDVSSSTPTGPFFQFTMTDDLIAIFEISTSYFIHSYRISTEEATLIASDGDPVSGGNLVLRHTDLETLATDGTHVAFVAEDSSGAEGIYSNRTGAVALDVSHDGLPAPVQTFDFEGEHYALTLRRVPFKGSENPFFIMTRIGGVYSLLDEGGSAATPTLWIDLEGSSVAYLANPPAPGVVRSNVTGEVLTLGTGFTTRPFFSGGKIVFMEYDQSPQDSFRIVLAHPLSIPALASRGALALALLLGALGAAELHRRIRTPRS